MIDLDWIISKENEITDCAKLKLGDNYMLSIDLLKLFCSAIKSFSKSNEVLHYFETQLVKDFHLAVLNIIRRHSIVANTVIRHAIESLILFAYSMEHKKEELFVANRDQIGITSYDDNILVKANKFIEKEFPEESKSLQAFKDAINFYYSHSNIYSAQFNTAIIGEEVKLLIFDNYFDDYIKNSLLIFNEIMCITLGLYKKLQEKYENFILIDSFNEEYNQLLKRNNNNVQVSIENNERLKQDFPDADKIIEKLNKKYDNFKC